MSQHPDAEDSRRLHQRLPARRSPPTDVSARRLRPPRVFWVVMFGGGRVFFPLGCFIPALGRFILALECFIRRCLATLQRTGCRSDKKPPNLGQMLGFLSQNRAQTPKFLKPKIEKSSFETRGFGEAEPPEGVVPPPFSKLQHVLPRNCLFPDCGSRFAG